jgi:EAL domain-containing protein (putative c-di-GMP-specific phosphodiesterase class I)
LLTFVCHDGLMGGLRELWAGFLKRAGKGGDPRLRILLWATLACLLFGAAELGQPLENALRNVRNTVRSHPTSGDIVLVGIDDRSLKELEKWPWPRGYHALLTDRLIAQGADRIFFTIDFSSRADPRNDAMLASALARAGRKVTLPFQQVRDPASGNQTTILPHPIFRSHVSMASMFLEYDFQGAVWRLPSAAQVDGVTYPSLAAELSGSEGRLGEEFRVDYSFDPRSVPSISAVDVIRGRSPTGAFSGKAVVVAGTSAQLGGFQLAPGHGWMSSSYIHILGAETLKSGRPVDVGWFLPFLTVVLSAGLCLLLPRLRHAIGAMAGILTCLLVAPFQLDASLIYIDTAPALVLLLAIAASLAWSEFRRSYRLRGTVNTVSGLPNLNALRQERVDHGRPLVAARIQNYAEIASALAMDDEKALIEQIIGRLTVGANERTLYQGDEGIFAWFAESETNYLGDHLDALHSLFRSPIVVGGNPLDLSITFGFDAGSGRSISNRLGSALVAADEAGQEALKWKRYDPAKLKDAAWRLSLLSQLDAAIAAGDVWIAYQPKLDLRTRAICGAEALVRWTHPEKGAISPAEFVAAAEQHDRIEGLTIFVLEGAIAAAAAIHRRGIAFNVAVNLSARLIDDSNLATTIRSLLKKHGLPASALTLEVTETAALSGGLGSLDMLWKLRETGVRISIDDYGTGLSTLDYLKKIPATEIKIDQTFVQAVENSRSDKLMVHSTIQLAHSLEQTVVAEGVEDSQTLETLAQMGCDVAQGYHIGRPMTFRALTRQVLGERRAKAA